MVVFNLRKRRFVPAVDWADSRSGSRMRNIRVALGQIAPRLGDLDHNARLHLEAVERGRAAGADLVVFPELSLTGYLLHDQVSDLALPLDHPVIEQLAAASRQTDIVAGLAEESAQQRFHNSAAYFSGGRLLHVHRKVYLPNYGMFQEARDFAAGDRIRHFDTARAACGMLICEDLWHPTSAWLLAQAGVDVIFVPSAGPTRGTSSDRQITSIGVWRTLLQVTAQFQTAFIVYVNRTGCEDGLTFGGGSMVVDPFGRVIEELPPLEEGLTVVQLEAQVLRRARTAYPLLRDERLELVRREIERIRILRYDLPDAEAEPERPVPREGAQRGDDR